MEYRVLGRTGLLVSVMGIGTGGQSRLGLSYGRSEDDAVSLVHRALELGVNYFDTAAHYGNEAVLGRALAGHRDEVVVSTKETPVTDQGTLRDAASLRASVEASLRSLRSERIDLFFLHRVPHLRYRYAIEELLPEVHELRAEGKIGWTAISESSGGDPDHSMLHEALSDDLFDVVMLSFNLFNQSARTSLFPQTIAQGVGVEIMASARAQFSDPARFARALRELANEGLLPEEALGGDDPLSLLHDGDRQIGVAEASYRFAAAEPGVGTVLVGTGRIEHLKENVAAFERGPLPVVVERRLREWFGHLREEVRVPGRAPEPT